MATSPRPTAVATLDVCAPAPANGQDWYAHWGLTHFLLDGHHKLAAAAAEGRAVRLLSLLAIDASLSTLNRSIGGPHCEHASRGAAPPAER